MRIAAQATARPAGATTRPRAARLAQRGFLLVLRTLLLVLAVHLSGAVHAVDDLVGECLAEIDSRRECPCDPAECPPGCPNCHGHGMPALPGQDGDATATGVVALDQSPLPCTLVDVSRPPSPERRGLYRPPQIA